MTTLHLISGLLLGAITVFFFATTWSSIKRRVTNKHYTKKYLEAKLGEDKEEVQKLHIANRLAMKTFKFYNSLSHSFYGILLLACTFGVLPYLFITSATNTALALQIALTSIVFNAALLVGTGRNLSLTPMSQVFAIHKNRLTTLDGMTEGQLKHDLEIIEKVYNLNEKESAVLAAPVMQSDIFDKEAIREMVARRASDYMDHVSEKSGGSPHKDDVEVLSMSLEEALNSDLPERIKEQIRNRVAEEEAKETKKVH